MKRVVHETMFSVSVMSFFTLVFIFIYTELIFVDTIFFLFIAASVGGPSWRCLINPLCVAEIGQSMECKVKVACPYFIWLDKLLWCNWFSAPCEVSAFIFLHSIPNTGIDLCWAALSWSACLSLHLLSNFLLSHLSVQVSHSTKSLLHPIHL